MEHREIRRESNEQDELRCKDNWSGNENQINEFEANEEVQTDVPPVRVLYDLSGGFVPCSATADCPTAVFQPNKRRYSRSLISLDSIRLFAPHG